MSLKQACYATAIGLSTLLATICTIAQARVAPIVFINDLPRRAADYLPIQPANRLCATKDSEPGVSVGNTINVRDFLGLKLKSIAITQMTNFESHEKFELAKGTIVELLQKSPKTRYRYEPWANAVHADFIAQINYSDGKTGELRCTYGYLCIQDHDGKHWWMRMTAPEDLNPTPVE